MQQSKGKPYRIFGDYETLENIIKEILWQVLVSQQLIVGATPLGPGCVRFKWPWRSTAMAPPCLLLCFSNNVNRK